nr:MAG TPA: hypothetical protein [Caudoviricetes sp.]
MAYSKNLYRHINLISLFLLISCILSHFFDIYF